MKIALSLSRLFILFALLSPLLAHAADDGEFFENKIRPLLADNCFKCHSHKSEKLKGKLYLDSQKGFLDGGETGPAVVPGDPGKSLVIEAVSYKNTDMQMPPKTKLSDQQVADLTEWVKRGAKWPANATAAADANTAKDGLDLPKLKSQHWAWNPLKAQTPPAVKDQAWPQSEIDKFILAKLEEKNLVPAAPADKRTLIRRVYFDLIGLPPTPEQVEAFANDASPDAYAKLIDSLLALPQFGERWARHWLDLTRYAESRGHEFDFPIPNAYQYRDYVIRALNADVPYDQFLKEQLAGDLISPPRLNPATGFNESILGTGFFFLGEGIHSPVDIRQDEADRFDNMVDVTCKTFMGLTVACARCHDHKFDAIRTKDYYSLFGFLQSSSYRLVRFEALEQNRKVANELWKLRAESAPALAKGAVAAMRPQLDRLGDYLLSARQAIQSGSEIEEAAANADVVFEDFEKGTYEGWKVTGNAFGKEPQTLQTISPIQGKINCVGHFFVNSFQIRDEGSGDAATGTMTSKAFTVSQNYISMLVGGGAHKDRTCVNLVIGGRAVLSATGQNNNQMFPVLWDVRPFKGKSAQIQIVDNETGGWGNIGCDQIVFTNKGGPGAKGSTIPVLASGFSPAFKKRIEDLAASKKLDPATLSEWVAHVMNAINDANDPFYVWGKTAADKNPSEYKKLASSFVNPSAAKRNSYPLEGAEINVDYANLGQESWFPDDYSFGPGPVAVGGLALGKDPSHPIEKIYDCAAGEFDPLWNGVKTVDSANDPVGLAYNRSGRTLKTRSFALTTGRVFFLARGSGRAYAAVDKHSMVNGPLHGQLIRQFDSKDGFQWQMLDLSTYKEHRTHIEFTSESADCAIAIVVQGEHAPPPPARGCHKLAEMLSGSVDSAETLAQGYQRLMLEIASRLENLKIAGADDAADCAFLANWLIQHPALVNGNEATRAPLEQAGKSFADAQAKLTSQIKFDSHLAMAMLDGSGEDDYVMKRGSWKNKGETAPRQLLEAIAGADQPKIKQGSGRLELANRMADPANPFTSRVMVNRLWHHLFGRGIVPSVDNFGVLGAKPSHPELLDYLALDFIKQGWSPKKMIRSMMLTSSYRMASNANAAADEHDPNNELLHRMAIRRQEGEIVRDNILAVSGKLDLKMYGPSVPIYLNDFMEGRGRPQSGPPDGHGRRSIYLSISRNFLSSMMLAFDMPIPFNTMGKRAISNVPAQALILMNDPFVVEQAKIWAGKMLADKALSPDKRIEKMYMAAFARIPTETEKKAGLEFMAQQAKELNIDAAHAGDDLRLWADYAHVLMNCKEFIFVN